MKKLYLVYGNTYFDSYGARINVFGVFSTFELAEKVKKQKEDEYFERESKDEYSEVEFQILEINADDIIDESLGGYAE